MLFAAILGVAPASVGHTDAGAHTGRKDLNMSDHITLVGNIVGDLEQRSTRNGGSIASFRLAVGERKLDRDRGEWVDVHTNYYQVSVFGELGANALRSLRKGERVILTGRLRLREWETDTKRGVSADVVVDAIGHDLRWGSSRFDRTPKPQNTGVDARPDAEPAVDESGWAVPGAPDESLAAVGAGGVGSGRPGSDPAIEGPF